MSQENYNEFEKYRDNERKTYPDVFKFSAVMIDAVFYRVGPFKDFEFVQMDKGISNNLVDSDKFHYFGFDYKNKRLITHLEMALVITHITNQMITYLVFTFLI